MFVFLLINHRIRLKVVISFDDWRFGDQWSRQYIPGADYNHAYYIYTTMTQQPWNNITTHRQDFGAFGSRIEDPIENGYFDIQRGRSAIGLAAHASWIRSAEDRLEPSGGNPSSRLFEGGAFEAPAYTRRRLDNGVAIGTVSKYLQVYSHGYGQVCMERAAGGV